MQADKCMGKGEQHIKMIFARSSQSFLHRTVRERMAKRSASPVVFRVGNPKKELTVRTLSSLQQYKGDPQKGQEEVE